MYPVLCERLNIENYQKKFEILLWIEEIERELQFRQYDQQQACLGYYPVNQYSSDSVFILHVPGLAEGRPSLIPGDRVHLENEYENVIHEGIILSIELYQVIIVLSKRDDVKKLIAEINKNELYQVQFFQSRGALRFYHWGLKLIQNLIKLDSCVLFPTGCNSNFKDPLMNATIESINFLNPNLNRRQKSAVINILRSECRPSPYILFGPPGTGKTVTLVECILQVFRMIHDSKILVCGVSNTCADTIALKLIESGWICEKNMIRIVAYTHIDKIPSKLKSFSKIFDDDDYWLHYRIIIVTCASAGKIALAAKYENVKFTHTFIDEAAQAMEPECILPIYLSAQYGGCTMIAGDPCQLGPFVTSSKSIGTNDLDLTFMERLCRMKCYNKKLSKKEFKKFGFYDPRMITRLVYSYRCCKELIEMNSRLFYNNELNCHFSMDKELLQKMNSKNFPIQFYPSWNLAKQSDNSPSWFNTAEAELCVKKLRKLFSIGLTEEDVGIITPYRGQCKEIKRKIKEYGLKRTCKIATIEEFQGGERRVIILSVVRSSHENLAHDKKFGLGFIFNDKRFNVATSRAKSLLIVIGNPDILELDETWRKFITYVVENHEPKTKFDKNWLLKHKQKTKSHNRNIDENYEDIDKFVNEINEENENYEEIKDECINEKNYEMINENISTNYEEIKDEFINEENDEMINENISPNYEKIKDEFIIEENGIINGNISPNHEKIKDGYINENNDANYEEIKKGLRVILFNLFTPLLIHILFILFLEHITGIDLFFD